MRYQPKIVTTAMLTAALAGAGTASAQIMAHSPMKPATRQLASGLSEKPFSRLFEQWRPATIVAPRFEIRQDVTRPNSARRFICAMPVLPGDPTIDPRMEKAPPGPATQFTLRIIRPSC